MRIPVGIVLATALLIPFSGCRQAELPDYVTASEKNIMATHREESKAGIGFIRSGDGANLKVSTCSRRNEVMWDFEKKRHNWAGRRSTGLQVVIFWNGRIWVPNHLPHDFDRNSSVVIFFDGNFVRFYDYAQNSGGYFMKYWQN